MRKDNLINSASKLKEISGSACTEYSENLHLLVAKVTGLVLEHNNIDSLIGDANASMMRDNHTNHAKFMVSIFENYNPIVFVETILWAFRTYLSHGFHPKYWDLHLNAWLKTISQNLSKETSEQISPYYIWMLEKIPIFVELASNPSENN